MTREIMKQPKKREYVLPLDWRTRPVLALGPAAVALGSSQSTVLRLGRDGDIKLLKIATRTLVETASLVAYLDRQVARGFFATARGNALNAARAKAHAAKAAAKAAASA